MYMIVLLVVSNINVTTKLTSCAAEAMPPLSFTSVLASCPPCRAHILCEHFGRIESAPRNVSHPQPPLMSDKWQARVLWTAVLCPWAANDFGQTWTNVIQQCLTLDSRTRMEWDECKNKKYTKTCQCCKIPIKFCVLFLSLWFSIYLLMHRVFSITRIRCNVTVCHRV